MLESLSQNFPSDASGCFVVRGSPNYTSSIAVYTLVVCFPVFAILRNVSAQHSSLFFYMTPSRSASLPVYTVLQWPVKSVRVQGCLFS